MITNTGLTVKAENLPNVSHPVIPGVARNLKLAVSVSGIDASL
jgi:hypothetical protein